MNALTADWRADLDASRDLSDLEKQNYSFLLAWYETWRLKAGLGPVREAAVKFWREQVKSKARKPWQLERWAEAMRWHEQWLAVCLREGREPRSLGERLHRSVMATGARRGLAVRTRETYAGGLARYGEWVGEAGEVMKAERASEWLTVLVDCGKVSYATQKQALNALAFFFKDVCGMQEVVFNVKLRKTDPRTPVVMSAREVLGLLDKLEGNHRLAAELQYGAGLRLSEVVRLRVKDIDRERGQVVVRCAKGDKDRTTILPSGCAPRSTRFGRICAKCMMTTVRPAWREWPCRARWQGKCRGRASGGSGFGSSRRRRFRWTPSRERNGGITFTPPPMGRR
jgi:hypothetical protein